MLTSEQVQSMALNNVSSQSSLIVDKPFTTHRGNQIEIESSHLKLQPFEKKSVIVSMTTKSPEKVEEYFEIMVRDGQSQFF